MNKKILMRVLIFTSIAFVALFFTSMVRDNASYNVGVLPSAFAANVSETIEGLPADSDAVTWELQNAKTKCEDEESCANLEDCPEPLDNVPAPTPQPLCVEGSYECYRTCSETFHEAEEECEVNETTGEVRCRESSPAHWTHTERYYGRVMSFHTCCEYPLFEDSAGSTNDTTSSDIIPVILDFGGTSSSCPLGDVCDPLSEGSIKKRFCCARCCADCSHRGYSVGADGTVSPGGAGEYVCILSDDIKNFPDGVNRTADNVFGVDSIPTSGECEWEPPESSNTMEGDITCSLYVPSFSRKCPNNVPGVSLSVVQPSSCPVNRSCQYYAWRYKCIGEDGYTEYRNRSGRCPFSNTSDSCTPSWGTYR